jgi:DNA-binding transcriptional ArsR family regulator
MLQVRGRKTPSLLRVESQPARPLQAQNNRRLIDCKARFRRAASMSQASPWRGLTAAYYFDNRRNMESELAIRQLSALAQAGRLAVFRLLVKAGPDGVAAGEIARALDIAPNTLSAQLNVLANAGLATSRREGRSIIYAAGYGAMTELLVYLMEDCCAGRPEVCAPLAEAAGRAAACCIPVKGALS